MKLGYFADGPWAHRALETITADQRFRIAFLVLRYGSADPHLQAEAKRLGVPCYVPQNVNDPQFVEEIRQHGADLFVSMSFDQILGRLIRDAAPLGFINCHAGALPFYRGRNVLNWAIINGESQIGVTVHFVDAGIDTGDIIKQIFFSIAPEDDYGSVLLMAYEKCARTLYEALVSFIEKRVERRAQASIHPVGFYCPRRKAGDENLDWRWESKRVVNFVRGITLPGPGARSRFDDREVAILKAALIADAPRYIAIPGAVVGRNESGVLVKTGDSTVLVRSVANVLEAGNLGDPFTPRFAIASRFSDR